MICRVFIALAVSCLCALAPAEENDAAPVQDVPHLEVERERPAKALVVAGMTLERGIACKRCEGAGKVEEKRRTVRTSSTGGVIRTVMVECKTCDGSTVQATQAINRTLRDVFETLAAVREEEDTEARFDALADKFREHVMPFASGLSARLREMLRAIDRAEPEDRIGMPFLVMGVELKKAEEGDYQVSVSGDGPTYIISNPRVVRALVGERVTCGGLIAGTCRVKDKEVLVLEHGVIIAK